MMRYKIFIIFLISVLLNGVSYARTNDRLRQPQRLRVSSLSDWPYSIPKSSVLVWLKQAKLGSSSSDATWTEHQKSDNFTNSGASPMVAGSESRGFKPSPTPFADNYWKTGTSSYMREATAGSVEITGSFYIMMRLKLSDGWYKTNQTLFSKWDADNNKKSIHWSLRSAGASVPGGFYIKISANGTDESGAGKGAVYASDDTVFHDGETNEWIVGFTFDSTKTDATAIVGYAGKSGVSSAVVSVPTSYYPGFNGTPQAVDVNTAYMTIGANEEGDASYVFGGEIGEVIIGNIVGTESMFNSFFIDGDRFDSYNPYSGVSDIDFFVNRPFADSSPWNLEIADLPNASYSTEGWCLPAGADCDGGVTTGATGTDRSKMRLMQFSANWVTNPNYGETTFAWDNGGSNTAWYVIYTGSVKLRVDPAVEPGASDSDNKITVIDKENALVWNFQQCSGSAPSISCSYAVWTDLYGSGTGEMYGNWHPAGPNAAQVADRGGMITLSEWENLEIPHALRLWLPNDQLGEGPEWPATGQDTVAGYTGRVEMGTRLALDPNVDIETDLSLTFDESKAIARALQKYGGIIMDRHGSGSPIGIQIGTQQEIKDTYSERFKDIGWHEDHVNTDLDQIAARLLRVDHDLKSGTTPIPWPR